MKVQGVNICYRCRNCGKVFFEDQPAMGAYDPADRLILLAEKEGYACIKGWEARKVKHHSCGKSRHGIADLVVFAPVRGVYHIVGSSRSELDGTT